MKNLCMKKIRSQKKFYEIVKEMEEEGCVFATVINVLDALQNAYFPHKSKQVDMTYIIPCPTEEQKDLVIVVSSPGPFTEGKTDIFYTQMTQLENLQWKNKKAKLWFCFEKK